MTIHYMDGGPFETTNTRTGLGVVVLAYSPENQHFVYVMHGTDFLRTGSTSADRFDPPPPIPAAARNPQVGEVWIHKEGAELLLSGFDKTDGEFLCLSISGPGFGWFKCCALARPATAAEAEPFRPLLDGLKRSLGEA